MAMSRRIERINSAIRQEISQLLRREVKDPRLNSFISVTQISTSDDLRHAKVFISVLGNEAEKKRVLDGLTSASGFFRRELAMRLRLKHMPELSFHLDDSIEHGSKVLKLIEEVTTDSKGEH